MAVQVREKTLEEIEAKLASMHTDLNKIGYIESALRVPGFSFEIKRVLWGQLSELLTNRKMFERAAKAMANKAGVETLFKDRMESYLSAGELYAKIGKIEDSEAMFTRAIRDADAVSREKIRLARKNMYLVCAQELERSGKGAKAVKYYEQLIKMKLDEVEKEEVRAKLIEMYKALGKFREAQLLEGM